MQRGVSSVAHREHAKVALGTDCRASNLMHHKVCGLGCRERGALKRGAWKVLWGVGAVGEYGAGRAACWREQHQAGLPGKLTFCRAFRT